LHVRLQSLPRGRLRAHGTVVATPQEAHQAQSRFIDLSHNLGAIHRTDLLMTRGLLVTQQG